MKILVVSDSHGKNSYIDQAVARESPFDIMAFCGDSERRLDEYEFNSYYAGEGERYGFYAVRGNCDFFVDYPEEVCFAAEGHKIFMIHGHQGHIRAKRSEEGLVKAALERDADIVLYGHTHIAKISRYEDGRILVVNPGSLTYPRGNAGVGTYATVEIGADGKVEAEIHKIMG
ncbi:MAG: metallophosphoesterase [Eubacterium sp.]|nr:metallophosphoesterase [Eubacterium sp.]